MEKLTTALFTLVTGEGDARARLRSAYFSFHTLKNTDFPLDQQKQWDWVTAQMTKCGPLRDSRGRVLVSDVENTMKHIQNKTASKIIQAIYELYWIVSENEQYR